MFSTTLKKTGNYFVGLVGVIAVLLIVIQFIPALSKNPSTTSAPELRRANELHDFVERLPGSLCPYIPCYMAEAAPAEGGGGGSSFL
ncbi:hypothetical protein [Endozoicomonas sp. ALD040]|uniref:hypothetical protein n=1 Tax=unclassified Endozoicomonas TaxID=2644528 RepID=UPI003BAF37BD